jgi:hypothetical protein
MGWLVVLLSASCPVTELWWVTRVVGSSGVLFGASMHMAATLGNPGRDLERATQRSLLNDSPYGTPSFLAGPLVMTRSRKGACRPPSMGRLRGHARNACGEVGT